MKKLRICIVGPGVVGQATGKVLAVAGHDVAFLGGSENRIQKLRREGFAAYDKNTVFNGSYDFDVTMFTVPTPTVDEKIDLSAIKSAAESLGKRLAFTKKYHVAVVKSTVPPGTTRNIVTALIEKHSKKKVGRDFGVCMAPEYLREEFSYEDTIAPWLITIGEYDKKSGDMVEEVFGSFKCPIVRTTLEEAEMQKYVHNLFNAAKITFFNEMRQIGESMGLDVDKIFKLVAISAEGMWNSKYGIRNRGPFDGSCLPKDTKAFLDWAEKNGKKAELLKKIIEVNNELMKQKGVAKAKIVGASL